MCSNRARKTKEQRKRCATPSRRGLPLEKYEATRLHMLKFYPREDVFIDSCQNNAETNSFHMKTADLAAQHLIAALSETVRFRCPHTFGQTTGLTHFRCVLVKSDQCTVGVDAVLLGNRFLSAGVDLCRPFKSSPLSAKLHSLNICLTSRTHAA